MKSILSARTKRQLELVELLFEYDWLPFDVASKKLDVPVKTIKSDIIDLEPLLDSTIIETSKRLGIHLVITPSFSKFVVYQQFLKNSTEFQLIESIFLENFNSIQDLADSLYISISTIKRIVSRINHSIQFEGFTIDLKKMRLVGDPYSICNFMQYYFYEKYSVAEKLVTPSQIQILEQVITSIAEDVTFDIKLNNLNFGSLNRSRLYMFTAINFLKNAKNQITYPSSGNKYAFLENQFLCDEFYAQFGLTMNFTTIDTIIQLFFGKEYTTSTKELTMIIKKDSFQKIKYQKLCTLIKNLEKKTGQSCPYFDSLLLHLYNLDTRIQGRSYIFYNRNYEFYLSLKNIYGPFPTEILYSLQAVFYSNSYKDYIVYEALHLLFTRWPQLFDYLEKSTPSMNVGLFFNTNDEYIESLAERISYYLRGRVTCTPLHITSLEDLDKVSQDFDCIISNIPNLPITDTPIVVMPLIPDGKSFDKLMLAYENHFEQLS